MLFGVGLAIPLAYVGFRFGPDFMVAARNGLLSKQEKQDYVADQKGNLKAMYNALLLYQESEGQLPHASGWMEAIESRLNTADLKDGQATKKLHRPGRSGNDFGYAMNNAFSAKYLADVKDQKAPLIYESKQTQRNANGDGSKDRDGMAISGSGELLPATR